MGITLELCQLEKMMKLSLLEELTKETKEKLSKSIEKNGLSMLKKFLKLKLMVPHIKFLFIHLNSLSLNSSLIEIDKNYYREKLQLKEPKVNPINIPPRMLLENLIEKVLNINNIN